MIRLAILIGLFGLAACSGQVAPAASLPERAVRIVSLDYCADQYVLKLVDRERILAVSPDAVKSFSYMREAAIGVPSVRPFAEDVLIVRPDLIVRSYGGGPNAAAFFERAGVPVLNVGWAGDLDGVRRVTLEMAEGLGEPERGAQIVADMAARLAEISPDERQIRALYMTPFGVTTGPGSLVHEMLLAAGLDNFQEAPGWHPLPLERLAYERPGMVVAAFFDSDNGSRDAWSAMRHPVARAQVRDLPNVHLEGAWTSCGAWFLVDAVEALAAGAP